MKKLLIMLLISGAVCSQKVTDKASIDKFLLKEAWIADYAMLNGLRVEQMGTMKSLQYIFKSDGTYVINGKSGKWTYNAKKKSIALFLDGTLKSSITSLQNKKFTMVLAQDKNTPKGSKFEIYFKPKK